MMKNKEYLQKIIEKCEDITSKNLSFSIFDGINIYLIKQILQGTKSLWLEIDSNNLDKFYEPVIFATAVHFFEKNYCEDKKIKPQIDDKYQKGKNRYIVIAINCEMNGEKNATKLKGIGKGNEDSIITTASMYGYTKLDQNTGITNRNTFKPMLCFLQKTLGEKKNIPSFPHKFAIVTAKNYFESCFEKLDKKAFPYTYIADSGQKTPSLPSADSMFFVASDYETIQEYIFDKDIKIENLIFIGNKYNHQIQQDLNRDYFKQVIFIGEQKPDVNCLKWRWTLPEYQCFDDLSAEEIKTIIIKNEILNNLIDEFIAKIKQLEKKHYVSLEKRIFPYISYIYPLVVLTNDSRLQNRIDDLLHSFDKKSEQVLGEALSNVDEDCTELHQQLVNDYGAILEQFYFENNAKTNALRQATETDYLLVPERQTLAVWKSEIKKLNWQETEVISFSKLKTLSKQRTVTVLSLQDYNFYCSIRDSNHKINWLLYDKEYQHYQNFVTLYENELIDEYKSTDRKKLISVDYPDEIKIESVDDLVYRFCGKETDRKEYIATYQDHIDKEIIFTDRHKVELSVNSTVILIDKQKKPRKYKVSDLRIDDRIRIYDNQYKEFLFYVISKSADNNNFNEILDHSKLWKKTLNNYCADDKIDKINEIANLCNVAPSTVEGWLKNSNTKFPKNIKPLKDILGNKYEVICSSNRRYNSIMIALGRDLSDEVSDYIISKQKGRLLSQFDDAQIESISEHNMPIRIIEEIKIIDKQDE